MEREGIRRGIYILPNLFTTANLFCGFFSMTCTLSGEYLVAAWVLFLAGVFDFLDGRVARLTKTNSEFGLEYDSLSDITSFGIAPALLLYKWNLFHFGRLGWAIAFIFFACGALRLARFNVQSSNVEKKHFQGLPIPAAAACPVGYVILHHHIFGPEPSTSYFLPLLTLVTGLLMVSKVPYHSFKVLDKGKRAQFFTLVIVIGVIAVIASAPQIMLFVFAMGYASIGVIRSILNSPKHIASFADLLSHYFHFNASDLDETDDEDESPKRTSLKVVGFKKIKKAGAKEAHYESENH